MQREAPFAIVEERVARCAAGGVPGSVCIGERFARDVPDARAMAERHETRPGPQRRANAHQRFIAAESDGKARRLATTQQMSFTNMVRGTRGLSQPPIDDIETYWSPAEKAQAQRMLARSIVGSAATVRAGIDALVRETGADELIVVSDIYDHPTRLRSFELIAGAAAG